MQKIADSHKSLIGITVALTGFALISFLADKRKQNIRKKELLLKSKYYLKILKKFRREFYAVFIYVKSLVEDINLVLKKDPLFQDTIHVSEIVKEKLFAKDSYYKILVFSIEERVFDQFNIKNSRLFQKDCAELAGYDPYIDALMKDIRGHFKSALSGQIIAPNLTMPVEITKELVIKTMVELHSLELEKMTSSFLQKNKLNKVNKVQFYAGMDLAEGRLSIFQKNGFDDSDDFHPDELLAFSIEYFGNKDKYFDIKVKTIESISKNGKNDVLAGNMSQEKLDSLKEEFRVILED